jgi:predicted transcriptional regulator
MSDQIINGKPMPHENLVVLTADIVSAHVANNSVAIADLATLIGNVHDALAALATPSTPIVENASPAVPVRSSIKPDYLVCLEDGKRLTMLKRYLMTNYQMTPADYRAKWNLPSDYPMVSPNYTKKRQLIAVQSGLGRKKGAIAPKASVQVAPKTGKARLKPRFVA